MLNYKEHIYEIYVLKIGLVHFYHIYETATFQLSLPLHADRLEEVIHRGKV
jgi:hypothetical protein